MNERMRDPDILSLWTIYDHPTDLPDVFVARRFELTRADFYRPRDGGWPITATKDTHTAATLEDVRAKLPPGLFRMPREPNDDPKIVEVWI